MNIDQALAQADMGKEEGLRGLYPVAAQVLAKQVRELREQNSLLREALNKSAKEHEEACKVLDQTAATS